jgi:hypothetical protein
MNADVSGLVVFTYTADPPGKHRLAAALAS